MGMARPRWAIGWWSGVGCEAAATARAVRVDLRVRMRGLGVVESGTVGVEEDGTAGRAEVGPASCERSWSGDEFCWMGDELAEPLVSEERSEPE